MNNNLSAIKKYHLRLPVLVNFLTLILAILHITVGWPGTWLAVFAPLWILWALWCVIYTLVMLWALTVLLRR